MSSHDFPNADLIDLGSIDAGLTGWRRWSLGAVGSTNTIALEHAQNGDPGRLWVTATEQLAGKGRRGRPWVSKPGNLYASLLLVDPADGALLSTLPLVVSVALHSALISLFPEAVNRFKIKWPNDVLLDGKKLSGILLEAASVGRGEIGTPRRAVVIGCGINCTHFPDNPIYPATSLEASGLPLAPDRLFDAFAIEMANALLIWSRGNNFAAIREKWLSHAQGIGKPIVARFETHTLEGTFQELDETGCLVLVEASGKVHRIAAADIFFGPSTENGA